MAPSWSPGISKSEVVFALNCANTGYHNRMASFYWIHILGCKGRVAFAGEEFLPDVEDEDCGRVVGESCRGNILVERGH